jgi:predicted nucleic acid-binding protein
VLLTLVAAKADYLVTGDEDLFALAGQYLIIKSAEFWARHWV